MSAIVECFVCTIRIFSLCRHREMRNMADTRKSLSPKAIRANRSKILKRLEL